MVQITSQAGKHIGDKLKNGLKPPLKCVPPSKINDFHLPITKILAN